MRRLLTGVLAVSVLGGCGESAPRAAAPEVESPLAAMDVRGAKGTVTYCVSEEAASERAAVTAFNAAQNAVKARYVAYEPSEYDQQHEDVQAGRCDVLSFNDTNAAPLAKDGSATDLTPYVDARRDEFFPSVLEAVRHEGRDWAMPRHVLVHLLFTRPGEDPPETAEDLFAKRRSVLVPDDAYGATATFLELAYAAGGTVLTADGRSAIDSPENREVLELLRSGALDRGDAPEIAEAFDRGDAPFMLNWNAGASEQATASVPPPFAEGEPAAVLSAAALAVPKTTKNRAAALTLLDYLTSEKAYEALARDHGLVPPTPSAFASSRGSLANAEAVKAALEVARPFPVSPAPAIISDAIAKAVNATIDREMTPAEALQDASAAIDAAMEQYG